ncbi:DUF6635 family protein [Jannaschia formosa]|uniref:DUF6635 family protein n=1 Tax=Jannaschia formosa TaxID=2259592 RepID=UPI0035208193
MRAKGQRTDEADAFVQRRFGWRETLRPHRPSLTLDTQRALVNVLLSILVAARIPGWPCGPVSMERLAGQGRRAC